MCPGSISFLRSILSPSLVQRECWKIGRVPVSAQQGVTSWASSTGRAGRRPRGEQGVVHGASRASSTGRAGRRPRGEQGVVHGASRASSTGASRASPPKQGVHQKYIDVFSLHRQSLQNKQCFHNPVYAYLSAARNRENPLFAYVGMLHRFERYHPKKDHLEPEVDVRSLSCRQSF
jgi:hypothetical protein